MFATVTDGRLAYDESGEGGTPLVLVHGFGLDRRMWDPIFLPLARTRRVIRYDLRGFGESSLPTAPHAHRGDLAALLDHLHLDRVDLVGLSLGGGLSVDFALEYSDRVRRLVLSSATLSGYKWSGSISNEAWSLAPTKGLEVARAAWINQPLFQILPAAIPLTHQLISAYSGWHWLNKDLATTLSPPAITRLASLSHPILTLVGALEPPDFHTIADLLVSHARARKLVLPTGHLAPMELPDLFLEHATAFLT